MAKSGKYYVVWEGKRPGIYDNWRECKLQIDNYPDARYKSFKTEKEAEKSYLMGYVEYQKTARKSASHSAKAKTTYNKNIVQNSICVDAACSGNPGLMEYRGVYTHDAEEIFKKGPYKMGTNNIGEFLAIVYAIALLQRNNRHSTAIYTDSRTAMAWVRKKKANTKLFEKYGTNPLEQTVEKAVKWLKDNSYTNPILKWDTKNWGEIPADFGRK